MECMASPVDFLPRVCVRRIGGRQVVVMLGRHQDASGVQIGWETGRGAYNELE